MFHSPLATNPAELAQPFADSIDATGPLQTTPEEEKLLADLDHWSEIANWHGLYFTQAGRALAIPVSFDADEPVSYVSFDSSLTFEGRLTTYSIIKIGRLIGASSIRALCLSFDDVKILPFLEPLPEDKLLHVPALAVDSMSRSDF